MKFTCDRCNAQYMISDEKVGPNGVKVRCKKCSAIVVVKRPPSAEAAAAQAPAPALASPCVAAPAAIPGFSMTTVDSPSSGGGAAERLTTMTWLHFLQRTLTPFGPTFSSEIMYCARQLSQWNFMLV